MLHTFVTSCLHKLVCVCLAVTLLTAFSHRIFKHRIILTKYFTWKYQTMLHFICRCSYLFTFLLFSQFHWHIRLKSTAYFFSPPCSWLLMLPSSSGERLCNATVSIYPSVCLSVPLIDSGNDVQLVCCWVPARRLISIDSCRRHVSATERHLPPVA